MPTSIREQILVAFKAKLTGLSGVTVYRMRRKPVDQVNMPAVNQLDGMDRVTEEVFGYDKREMPVAVEGFAAGATDEAMASAASDLEARVVAAVLSGDRRLGGLCVDIAEGEAEFDADEGDGKSPEAAFARTFLVTFFTGSGDPFAAGP